MLAWIFSLPGARPVHETPGEVVSRFRDDVDHTVEAMDFTVDFVGSMLSALVAVILLFSIDPVITMVVFAPVAIIILVVSRTGSTIRRYRTAARESTEAITGFLGETLGSVQSVKVAGAESTMLEHFNELNDVRRKMMVRDRTFTAGLEDAGSHDVLLRLSDPEGQEMVSLNGTIQLGPGPAAGGGRIRVPHILNLDGLVFQKPGTHVFDVSLDGEHSVTIPLRVQGAGPQVDGPVVQA